MTAIILDINDASLALWRNGEVLLSSPGYALLQGREYQFGEGARSQARRHPQQVNHRYWSQLNTEPMTPAFGPGRHSADLVHSHLLEIHQQAEQPDELIIAAPGSLQHDQLALLLGIIDACPFAATGLVDRAVAAAAEHGGADYNWHIELQLHQALITGLVYRDGELQRDQLIPIPGAGWLALQDSLARGIADAFIRQTRFDPRRQASTEQALYDLLPTLLDTLTHSPEHNLELGGHNARVERALLAQSCNKHYQRLQAAIAARPGQVLLADKLATMPDISALLPEAQGVDATAMASSIARHEQTICGGEQGLHFITSLPCSKAQTATTDTTAAEPPTEPSAEPAQETVQETVSPSRCQIDIENHALTLRPLSGPTPQVNGEAANGPVALSDKDIIELADGTAWQLVQVKPEALADDGST